VVAGRPSGATPPVSAALAALAADASDLPMGSVSPVTAELAAAEGTGGNDVVKPEGAEVGSVTKVDTGTELPSIGLTETPIERLGAAD